jgi:NADH-quinone oxidoreductase subunit G
MRILPRIHEDVNEEWISDKTRFAYDGLKRQRLDTPYVRRNGRLEPATWAQAFQAIADRIKGLDGDKVAAVAGDLACCESMLALKDLVSALGSPHIDCRQDGAKLPAAPRAAYLFNTGIAGIEEADLCLLVGANPRLEAALVNARLRKRYLVGGFRVAAVGPKADLTYPVENLGAGPRTLEEVASGKHPFADTLKAAARPMLILGQGALARPDGAVVLGTARKIAEDCGLVRERWNGFNVLHLAAARVGGLDLGLVPGEGGRDVAGILEGAASGAIEVVYLLNADEIDMAPLEGAFVVYQGHHGDAGAQAADVILPGAAYTEKNATYVNTEGRVQRASLAVFPPGDAREDWKILRALGELLGVAKAMPYASLAEIRARLGEANPVFQRDDAFEPGAWGAFGAEGALDPARFAYPVANYYMTDPVTRASVTMAKCTEAFVLTQPEKTGTHG